MNSKRLLSHSAFAALVFCGHAHAVVLSLSATLSGANEVPASGSLGTGLAQVTIDTVAHTLFVDVSFSGLTGTVTAAHIHAGSTGGPGSNVGVATPTPTFPGFPSGVTSGSYTTTLDLTMASSFNPAFITANGGTAASAETALYGYMSGSNSYFNIHTTFSPGGEIRGNLAPTVPDGGLTVLMLAASVGVMVGLRRNRRIRA